MAFPLDLSEDGLHAPFPSVSLQLIGERPAGTAKNLLVGGFRVVMRDEPESPLSLQRIVADGRHGVRTVRRDGGIELAADDDPNSWQSVRIPLSKLLPEGATALTRISIQFTGLPALGRAGLLVRNFRFE